MMDRREEKTAERRILLKKVFQPLGLLAIGRRIGDTYCIQFNESGYDKDYKCYREDEVVSRLSGSLSDEQLVGIIRTNPDALNPYWDFYGKYYTFVAPTKELRLGSVWPDFRSKLDEVFRKHEQAAWAVLKAYLELREDYSTWSSCDYNKLQYRAKELAGREWKNALIGLEVVQVVKKRGSGRRPGERSVGVEMIPLIEEVVRDWEKSPNITERVSMIGTAEVKSHVFVCYSHQDSSFVDRLVQDLSSRGIEPWIDKWGIRVGDSIVERINEGIRKNDYLIIVLSRASVKSEWVKKELNAALMKELNRKSVVVLPILLEECEIPPLIADKKYADFRQSYDAGLAELLDRFKK